MITLIDNFYPDELYADVLEQVKTFDFNPSHQPCRKDINRYQAYPVYETNDLKKDNPAYQYLEKKLQEFKLKPFKMHTFYRKTLLSELKKSLSWDNYAKHIDGGGISLAGVIYLNTQSIQDGTSLYNDFSDYEPTLTVASKPNRFKMYNSNIIHSPGVRQWQEERIIQPFFIEYA